MGVKDESLNLINSGWFISLDPNFAYRQQFENINRATYRLGLALDLDLHQLLHVKGWIMFAGITRRHIFIAGIRDIARHTDNSYFFDRYYTIAGDDRTVYTQTAFKFNIGYPGLSVIKTKKTNLRKAIIQKMLNFC